MKNNTEPLIRILIFLGLHQNYGFVIVWPLTSHKSVTFILVLLSLLDHNDDVIRWKHFPRYWPMCGEFTGPGEFPAQRPVTQSSDVFFDMRLNKRMSKQPWGWRFGNLSSRLHVSNSGTRTLFDWKCGVSVFHSCNIRIVWGLWSQSNFHDMIISIVNISWLHWIINCLVVMHPYALSHNKAVLNWNKFVWSIRLTLIQGLIASRSNKQQPTDAVN